MVWDPLWHTCLILRQPAWSSYKTYTELCFSPGGNCHDKQISPITNDQPRYHPKPMEVINQACPPRYERSFPKYLSIWEWCIEIKSYIHGPLYLIKNKKVNLRLVHQLNVQNTHTAIQYQKYRYNAKIPMQLSNFIPQSKLSPKRNPFLVSTRNIYSTNRFSLTQFTTLLTNYH